MASLIRNGHLDQVVLMHNAYNKFTTTLILLLVIILIPFANPLSFEFTSFSPTNPNITYEPSAYTANNTIQLTTNQRDSSTLESVGRATYANPVHLWDKTSGNLTDFSTNFTFSINSLNNSIFRDGMAFFLAPYGSRIRSHSQGGSMGLTSEDEMFNSTNNPFVAVEFDIYTNGEWDPPGGPHVGIDINSVMSVANVSWSTITSIMEGRAQQAIISYDSGSRNLNVAFTYNDMRGTQITQGLSYVVDLREYLPEFVNIGFSAATGNATALYSIYSWSFSSNLETNNATAETNNVPTSNSDFPPNTNVPGSRRSRKKLPTSLPIGLSLGVFVFVLLVGFIIYLVRRLNEKKSMTETDKEGDHDDTTQGRSYRHL